MSSVSMWFSFLGNIVYAYRKYKKKLNLEFVFPENAECGKQGTGILSGYYIYNGTLLLLLLIWLLLGKKTSKNNNSVCVCVFVQFKDSRWLSADRDETNRISSVDLNSYIDHMSKTSSYGDGIMLEMAVAKYKRPICIVSKDFPNESILLSNDEVDTARCMFLGYSGSDHYDSILPCPTIYSTVSTAAAASTIQAQSTASLSQVCNPATSMPVESTSVTSKQTAAVSEASASASSSAVKSIPELASTENSNVVVYPTVWTFDKWESWKKKLPWLICRNDKVGCAVCCDAGTTQTVKAGVHISAEWTAVSVEAKTARKLKEKIYKHRDSKAHIAAKNILKVRQQDLLKGVIIDADSHYFEETSRVFRTAYAIAKMDLSFTAHRGLLVLQEANGLDVGKVHKSDHSCSKIISHISSQMKKTFCERLKSLSPHVAVMLDESTLYKKSVIAVYLRTRLVDISESAEDMLETNYGVTNVYFGLVEESEGCTAKGIMGAVEREFDQFKLNDLLLQNKLLIAICTDGASVMTGTSSGVATQFIERYGENVEAFHYLAHRLELAVNDALKSVTATNHFQSFLKSLYALYSQSPKNQRELGEVAADTETQLLRITAIFDVRWVASSFTTVRAVWRNFPALHNHFRNASLYSTRTSTERAKFAGLLKKLTTVSFLNDLAIMKDVLRELSSLSLKLQSRT
jgi:hypothetical protein